MAATNPGFEVIEGGGDAPQPAQPDPNKVAIAMIMLGIKALSARALTAATDLFTLITCGGAWWLWYLTPDPNPQQIVHNSIFALFVLAANYIVRRK